MVEEKRDDYNTKRSFAGDDFNGEISTSTQTVEPTSKKPKLEDGTDSDSIKTDTDSTVSEQKLAESTTKHSNTEKSETDDAKSLPDSENVKSQPMEADNMNSEIYEEDNAKLKSEMSAQISEQLVSDLTDMDETNPELNVDYSMYQPGMMNLCDDVLLIIMRHCSARDRKALAFSCRRLNELSRDRMLWNTMDLRSDAVGRKQLTWFLNEFANKHTTAVMIKGHADSSRGCMGKKRMKPEVDKDTKNLRNAAMKVHSLMQDYYGPADQPAPSDPLRARVREARKKTGAIRMTATADQEVQTDNSALNDDEVEVGQNTASFSHDSIAGCSKDGPAPKKQKIDPNSEAGTSGVGGNSIRNVGEIEIIKTPKNGASTKDTKMEIDDQKPGPSGLREQNDQKPASAGLKRQNDEKPNPSGIEVEDDQKPGPSGLQIIQDDQKHETSCVKDEETDQNVGKVEIVRTPKKGCAKKIEMIQRECEKMRRELRRAGIDYSGLDKIRACLNEKACQTGSDDDSYAWSNGCQSKAEDDSDSCSSSSSSSDSDTNSLSMDEENSDNDRIQQNNAQQDDRSPMIPEYHYPVRVGGGPQHVHGGVAEPVVVRAGNDDSPDRERDPRLAALDLSGQNPGGNIENDPRNRRNHDGVVGNAQNVGEDGPNADRNSRNDARNADAPENDVPQNLRDVPNDVVEIVNMAQDAANIADDLRNMADGVANLDMDFVRMVFNIGGENGDANANANIGDENVGNVPADEEPANVGNVPNVIDNMEQNVADIMENIELDIDRMAFDGNPDEHNVGGAGEHGDANAENGNADIDDEQPMEVAVEFAINAAQIADHAADFADHAADIADNAANFVENAVDNMAQEQVIDEEEVALDLALDAAAIAERAADFAVQAADIADNAAIIAENAVENNDGDENAVANDAEMLNVALGIAMDAAENVMENEVFNRNNADNPDHGNPAQQNVIYMAFEGFGRDNENNNAGNAPFNMQNVAANENDGNAVRNDPAQNDPVGNDANAAVHAAQNAYNEDHRGRLNNRFGPIGNRRHGWQPFRGFRLRRHPAAEENRQRERQYYVRGGEYSRPGMEYCDNYWPTPFESERAALRMKKKEAERESKRHKTSKSRNRRAKQSKKKYECSGPKWTVNSEILRRLAETCPNLAQLSLENCNINTHMVKLSDFPKKLKSLSLKGCRCYNTVVNKSFLFKVQDHLPDLEEMDISDCSWIDAASLLPLSKLKKLKVLKACNCVKMTECVAYASLAARFGFRSLEVLDLRGSPMGDSEVSAFGWLPNLREMYLAPPTPTVTPRDNKHLHALYDHTTDTSDVELWEGDEDSPEVSFRTAERVAVNSVTRHCCLDPGSGCTVPDYDPMLSDPLQNNLHCSPEICNHTHRYTEEESDRAARERHYADLEGRNRSRSTRERDLEREIARRVGELLRRNRAEGERQGQEGDNEDAARILGDGIRAPLPGDGAADQEGNGEEEQGHRRPRRNVEEVMRAWDNLAQEWHSRERNRNRARRLNMQRPVVQFREPGLEDPREVRVDAGGRYHVIYVNARRPRQDLAHGQVRVEAPNNARPPNEPAQRDGYVNIRREYINGPANIRSPLYGILEPPGQVRQAQGDGPGNPRINPDLLRCACYQGPVNDNGRAEPAAHNQDLPQNLARGNLPPREEPHRCLCDDRRGNHNPNPGHENRNRGFPGVPWMQNILPEALPQWGDDFPYAINPPPPPFHHFVRRNNGPDVRNRAPGQADHVPRQADQVPRQADHVPRQADQVPRQADQVPRQADHVPRQADQVPRQADQVPRQADQVPRLADLVPRQADQGHRQADEGPRQADQAPRQANQVPRQADPVPRQADQAPRQADQAPRIADQAPRQVNQGLEWHIGREHVFRLQGHRIVPDGDNPRPEARVNVRREFLNGPAQFRIPNQEDQREPIHMNIHVHREIFVDGNLVQQEGDHPAPNNEPPQQRPPVGIMRMPFIQNIFYGPVGGHIEGSSLISDSSLLRFGLSAGNRNNFVHIGANGALQAVFPHANWTDKPEKARLEILVVRGYTGVTNRTLQHFATAAPQLREIDLTDTSVTLQGVESFSAIRPDVKVICDHLKEKKNETKKE